MPALRAHDLSRVLELYLRLMAFRTSPITTAAAMGGGRNLVERGMSVREDVAGGMGGTRAVG